MNVGQNMLPMFLKTAESLQVRGLTENNTLNPKVIFNITLKSLAITGTICISSVQINLILCMYNYEHYSSEILSEVSSYFTVMFKIKMHDLELRRRWLNDPIEI